MFTNNTKLIQPNEAAAILGVTASTLTVWRSTGRYTLPYVKVGARVMYQIADIYTFIEQRTIRQAVCGGVK